MVLDTDQASAGSVLDLKRRGMLSMRSSSRAAKFGFVVKLGCSHGSSDDYCFDVAEDDVRVHDFRPTFCMCLISTING